MKRYGLILWGVLMLATALAATDKPQEKQQYSRRTPIVEAFEKNKDAVVSISGKQLTRQSDIFFWDIEDWFLGRLQPRATPFLGSGFILDSRGYIVTNAHVVQNAVEINVTLSDGTEHQAQKIAADSAVDLALVKISTDKSLPTVNIRNRDDLMIGETVLAIGNPFGYQHTLTDGIISAVHHDMEIEGTKFPNLIQISAPINPGNSGGPLLNINGEVIGINTAIRRAAEGIGFAIPIDLLRLHLPIMLGKEIELHRRIDFGLMVGDLFPAETGVAPAASAEKGLLVRSVRAESAAAQAGFQTGDIIKKVNGADVDSALDFYLGMLQQETSGRVRFDILRQTDLPLTGDRVRPLSIELPWRTRPQPDGAALAQRLFGLKVESLSAGAARQYGGYAEAGRVMVRAVEENSPAEQAEIKPDDLIVSVGGVVINNQQDLGLQLEMISGGNPVEIKLQRIQETIWGSQLWQITLTLRAR